MEFVKTAERKMSKIIKKVFLTNVLSNIFGKFASFPFPAPIQSFINNSYVKLLDLDMNEFKKPSEYRTLNALFTRELIAKRYIDTSSQSFISPSDSLITECGDIDKNTVFQIKGMPYCIDELLIDFSIAKKLYNGKYINFYLSPKDYHRYHMPHNLFIKKAIHIPGKLYPVNFWYLNY